MCFSRFPYMYVMCSSCCFFRCKCNCVPLFFIICVTTRIYRACYFNYAHFLMFICIFYIVYLQWVEEIKLYKYNDIIRTIAWCVFLVVTCVPDEVSNSAKSPDQATYDYLTNVTYTCNIGYVLTSGDATRTCQADGNWNGTVPICSSKKML